MADLFEVCGVNAKLKVPGGKEFDFVDPKFNDKISLIKEIKAFSKLKPEDDDVEYRIKERELAKRYVQLYVPKLTSEDIEEMGTHAFETLQRAVTEMASSKLGAYVRKIEPEAKKELATSSPA